MVNSMMMITATRQTGAIPPFLTALTAEAHLRLIKIDSTAGVVKTGSLSPLPEQAQRALLLP